MRVLLYEYKESLRLLKKRKRELHSIVSKKKELEISQYKIVITPFFKEQKDIDLLNNMISDIEYAIEWIQTGRQPRQRRGIDRTDVYITDPFILDSSTHYQPLNYGTSNEDIISQDNRDKLREALCTLTDRERETFILCYVEQLTYQKIGELLGVKLDTVKTTLKRARRKIEKRIKEMDNK